MRGRKRGWHVARFGFLFMCVLTLLPSMAGAADAKSRLTCDVGPVTRGYGGTDWLIYSCHDGESLTFVAAPGSPAAPFYFSLFKRNGKYVLAGEGKGDKAASDAADAELMRLSPADIAGLIAATSGGASVAAPDPALQRQLVGHWVYHDGQGDNDLTFGADGSFSGILKQAGKTVWTYGGTWNLEGNRIVYRYTLSIPPIIAVGLMDLDTVWDMTPQCFTLMSAATELSRVCRAP